MHLDDLTSTARQLQFGFHAACEEAWHPAEVPRLRGSHEIDALQEALFSSKPLRLELARQLERYTRVYAALMSGFGRFRKATALPGESLLALMKRTHLAALQWRPPGRSAAETLAM